MDNKGERMMKKITKIGFTLVLVSAFVAILASCGGNMFSGIYREYSGKDTLVKSFAEVELGSKVTSVSFKSDDFVTYSKEVDVDGGTEIRALYVRNLKTGVVIDGHKDNTAVTIDAGKDNNIIYIDRNFSGESRRAFYGKDGALILDFNKDNASANYKALFGNVFALSGKVYNGKNMIISTGGIDNTSFSMYGKDYVLWTNAAGTAYTLYDLNGKVVYSYDRVNSDVKFYFLTKDTALLVTTKKLDDPVTATLFLNGQLDKIDYTYNDGANLWKQTCEIVEFKSGKISKVNFNYKIAALPIFPFTPTVTNFYNMPDDNLVYFNSDITKCALISGIAINKDKTLAKEYTILFVDEFLGIKETYTNIHPSGFISNDRAIVYNYVTETYSLVNGNNEVIQRFESPSYDYVSKLIKSGGNYYDIDGKMVINSVDYSELGSFVGNYAYAVKKEKDAKDKPIRGFIDNKGKFTQVVEYDAEGTKTNNLTLGLPDGTAAAGIYSYGKVGEDTVDIKNYAGTLLKTFDTTKETFVQAATSSSSINSIYAEITKDSKTYIYICKV